MHTELIGRCAIIVTCAIFAGCDLAQVPAIDMNNNGMHDGVDLSEFKMSCMRNEDCTDSQLCLHNICITKCTTDDDCIEGLICRSNGICNEPGFAFTFPLEYNPKLDIATDNLKNCNFTVNWGDASGKSQTHTTCPAALSHEYDVSELPFKTVTVSISGKLDNFTFHDDAIYEILSTCPKHMIVESFGNIGLAPYAFFGCESLVIESSDIPDPEKLTDMSHFFESSSISDMTAPKPGKKYIGDWDVSNVTNMESMFSDAHYFNQPIGNWDVSKVKNMEKMFDDANSFNQPIGNWNVSNVENMIFMFIGASEFDQNLSSWNLSGIDDPKNIENIFYLSGLSQKNYCKIITNNPIFGEYTNYLGLHYSCNQN